MFDLNPQFPNNPNHPVDKLNHKFVGWNDSGFARINQNHGNYSHRHRFNGGAGGSGGGGVQFRLETMEEDSGVCSPPLWRSTSPPDSPVRFNNPRLLSPASRAQAIARGQREIMEMVQNMPETSYELSLKDIVEQRRDVTDVSVDETQSMEEGEDRSILGGGQTESQRRKKNKKGSVKRQESNKTGRIIVKNGSINHNKGLLINMFFPFSIGSQKKRSSIRASSSFGNSSNHGAGSKISPKPELLDKTSKYGGGGGGGDRRDWWWKRFTGSTDSESLGITSSSSGESTGRSGSSGSSASGSVRSNSARKHSDCSYGCWSFFPSRKRKS